MRRERRLEAVRRWVGAVLYSPGIQDSEGDVMSDDDDYNMIDEIMYLVTVVFLVLMTITFVAGIAGFIWALI